MARNFYEFFAGGGMARAGLGTDWQCIFANDFDAMKVQVYESNWGHRPNDSDISSVKPGDLPGQADLAWASFPCQDLSLAGDYRGLGHHATKDRTRSGTFWPFWGLIRELARQGRAPKTIILENVYGALTSNLGRDFSAIASALSGSNYRFGAVVINANLFVPQSRPRLFIIAALKTLDIPPELMDSAPSDKWHPAALLRAYNGLSDEARNKWVWWKLRTPRKRTKTFSDVIESEPTGVQWDAPEETSRLLGMMSKLNREKVSEAKARGPRVVGGVYKRTRTENDVKTQRAEVRFDDIAGCLRTPGGGSSRQRILVIEGNTMRSRLLSPREAARLMGLPESYKLPVRYNDAYHVAGDGVVVPVVRYLASNLIEPMLSKKRVLEAAE